MDEKTRGTRLTDGGLLHDIHTRSGMREPPLRD